jgi:hypothetical protein
MKNVVRRNIHRSMAIAVLFAVVPGASVATCVGDCDGNGHVEVNELVTGVRMALRGALDECLVFDVDGNRLVSVDELTRAVSDSLYGCVPAKPFRSIQEVFDTSCAFSGCHAVTSRQGQLVLSDEFVSYENLVDKPPHDSDAAAMGLMRVASGDPENSYLLRKLRGQGPGDPMPVGFQPLPDEIIDIIEDWIVRGAHSTAEECPAAAEGAGGGAHAGPLQTICDDKPIEGGDFVWEPEPPLEAPPPGTGVQFYVPPRPVDPGTEWETCYAFKPDWEQLARDNGQDGGLPVIKHQTYRMHEGSHHLLVYTYFGNYPDWEWPQGFFECAAANCRLPGQCPPDNGQFLLPVGGTQVAGTRYEVSYPQGIGFPVLSKDAVIIANLHYTNPFRPAQEIHAEAWINLEFAKPGEFKGLLDGIFAIGYRNLFVEPFRTRTMSQIWQPRGLLSRQPVDAAVFQLFGHMHKRGKEFKVDFVKGGSCSASGRLCGRDSDCECRQWESAEQCERGQTCMLSDDHEDTTIYSTTSWDNAPVNDYPPPYLRVNKDQGLRWTCTHVNGVPGDPDNPVKKCHEGCGDCGWDAATRTCVFDRGIYFGVDTEPRIYQEGDPMPLVFGELADDDMCNMFGYFIPQDVADRLE